MHLSMRITVFMLNRACLFVFGFLFLKKQTNTDLLNGKIYSVTISQIINNFFFSVIVRFCLTVKI